MSEWQPIETAPRDGTRVLGADGITVDIMHWSTSVWANGGGWVNDLARSDTWVYSPDYWMQIPKSPWTGRDQPMPTAKLEKAK